MYVLSLLGMLLDDLRNTASRFDSFQTGSGAEIEPHGKNVEFEKAARSLVDDETAHDFSITIEPDENCNFVLSEISFINGSGEHERQPLQKKVADFMEMLNLTNVYHTLCNEIIESGNTI